MTTSSSSPSGKSNGSDGGSTEQVALVPPEGELLLGRNMGIWPEDGIRMLTPYPLWLVFLWGGASLSLAWVTVK